MVCSHPQSVCKIQTFSMRYPHMLHRRNFLAILLRGHLHCQCGYIWYVWTEPCWELLNIRIYIVRNEQGRFEVCRIMVKLQRRHAFLMVNIFSFFLLLAIVNLFVFMVPMDSAESVSYAITISFPMPSLCCFLLPCFCHWSQQTLESPVLPFLHFPFIC